MQIYMALLVLGLIMFAGALLLGALLQHSTEQRLRRHRMPQKQARDARRLNVRRAAPPSGLQLRFVPAATPDQPATFSGYAVKWDSINSHGEQWVRGAFAESIAAFDAGEPIHLYYNHGHMTICPSALSVRVGKWTKLVEDDVGLYCEGELTPGLSSAQMLGAMMRHGTVDGLSVCFFEPAPEDVQIIDQGNTAYMLIRRARLYEISIVDEPSDRDARLTDEQISAVAGTEQGARMLAALGIEPREQQQPVYTGLMGLLDRLR